MANKVDATGASADSAGQAQVQATVDTEEEKGYRGTRSDPTPLENYTVAGQNAGKPTPETSLDLKVDVATTALKPEPLPTPPAQPAQPKSPLKSVDGN